MILSKTTAYIPPGIVVENFSYVYQQQGTASLTRGQMRAFKKAWAEFDLESTGYLRRDKIGPFLGVCDSRRGVLPYNVNLYWRSVSPAFSKYVYTLPSITSRTWSQHPLSKRPPSDHCFRHSTNMGNAQKALARESLISSSRESTLTLSGTGDKHTTTSIGRRASRTTMEKGYHSPQCCFSSAITS